jgi:hypothetical protein
MSIMAAARWSRKLWRYEFKCAFREETLLACASRRIGPSSTSTNGMNVRGRVIAAIQFSANQDAVSLCLAATYVRALYEIKTDQEHSHRHSLAHHSEVRKYHNRVLLWYRSKYAPHACMLAQPIYARSQTDEFVFMPSEQEIVLRD